MHVHTMYVCKITHRKVKLCMYTIALDKESNMYLENGGK